MEQEVLTLPEHLLSSTPVFSVVCVTRSFLLYVCFVDRCLSFYTFSFGHCVFCSSSIHGLWLPLWYLQTTLLIVNRHFEITDTTDTDKSASYLDLHLKNDSERRFRTKLYDKGDDFNFPIVNFPFIYRKIPAAPAYRLYISQLIRYSRVCNSDQDFLDRGLLLTRKLLNQGFLLVKLKSSRRKFYGRQHDLVDRYGIPVSQMTMDMLHLS